MAGLIATFSVCKGHNARSRMDELFSHTLTALEFPRRLSTAHSTLPAAGIAVEEFGLT